MEVKNTKYMLLGINGKKRSGKNTVGELTGFNSFGFADKLKELALESNPALIHDVSATRNLKDLVAVIGWEESKEFPEVRQYLQNLGVGARKVFGEQFWINQLFGKLSDMYGEYTADLNKEAFQSNIVITDVRFPNEAQAIRDYNGYIIKVVRPETEVEDSHESEQDLPEDLVDFTIHNSFTQDFLGEQVRNIIEEIRNK